MIKLTLPTELIDDGTKVTATVPGHEMVGILHKKLLTTGKYEFFFVPDNGHPTIFVRKPMQIWFSIHFDSMNELSDWVCDAMECR